VGPDSNAGEQMALGESAQVCGPDIEDASLINFSICNQSCLD
jgi:hypothetical protein